MTEAALRSRPTIMGIVNVTPDSFSDGGRYDRVDAAVSHGLQLINDGADVIDVGGESTRPGAEAVTTKIELERVVPVIRALAEQTQTPISIDTRKSAVARAAIGAGATIWNDVSALQFDDDSVRTAVDLGCRVVLMHAKGIPADMQADPTYVDVVAEVAGFLAGRTELFIAAGGDETNVMIDPGIGFGKTLEHNISLLRNLDLFNDIGPGVLLGASRKRFIAGVDQAGPADSRIGGSLAAALIGWHAGVSMVRVHDVAETRQAFAVTRAISDEI